MDIDQTTLDVEASLTALLAKMLAVDIVKPNAYEIVHRPVVITQEMRERIWALTANDLYVEARFEYMEIIDVEFVVLD